MKNKHFVLVLIPLLLLSILFILGNEFFCDFNFFKYNILVYVNDFTGISISNLFSIIGYGQSAFIFTTFFWIYKSGTFQYHQYHRLINGFIFLLILCSLSYKELGIDLINLLYVILLVPVLVLYFLHYKKKQLKSSLDYIKLINVFGISFLMVFGLYQIIENEYFELLKYGMIMTLLVAFIIHISKTKNWLNEPSIIPSANPDYSLQEKLEEDMEL